MSDVQKVPFEGKAGEKANLLLAAAEELGLDPSVVGVTDGAFVAPAEVVEQAFGSREKSGPEEAEVADPPRPTKKSAPKKSTTTKAQE